VQKFILMSVVLAMICVPILAAHERSAARSLKKILLVLFVFNLFYLLAVRFGYSTIQ
jgi:hypothetical protein